MTAADLLRKENKARLVRAIGTAEKNTSGEIRVHLEQVCKGDPYLRAAYVFSRLGMFDTKDRNGVLIYLAMKSHKFAIVGDSGINARVGAGFWNDYCWRLLLSLPSWLRLRSRKSLPCPGQSMTLPASFPLRMRSI